MSQVVSGVYVIRCIPTGKIYVGSSGNIATRWNIHRGQLTRGTHINTYLQAAWNKHGADAFAWEIIEAAEEERLIEREQHFIDSLHASNRKHGFNLRIFAHSNRGIKMPKEHGEKLAAILTGRRDSPETNKRRRAKLGETLAKRTLEDRARIGQKIAERNKGRQCSEETKARMSASHRTSDATAEQIKKLASLTRGKPMSEEHKAKISAARKGCTRTPEHRAKLSEANRGKLLSPERRASMAAGQRRRHAQKRRQTPCRQQEFDF